MALRGSAEFSWEAISEPAVPENGQVLKRIGHAAVPVDGQYIYIIGGRTRSVPTMDVLVLAFIVAMTGYCTSTPTSSIASSSLALLQTLSKCGTAAVTQKWIWLL